MIDSITTLVMSNDVGFKKFNAWINPQETVSLLSLSLDSLLLTTASICVLCISFGSLLDNGLHNGMYIWTVQPC